MFSSKKKRPFLSFITVLALLLLTFGGSVSAYPGSGQGKGEPHDIDLIDAVADYMDIVSDGALVNPLFDNPETFMGETATFGQSCLTCHGGSDGAQSPNQKYHEQITYELIRVSDGENMVQPDGTLLFELDPNGGVTKYKLIVGLSEDVYDGGHEDDRALAGWHFSLPTGVQMDLPYCMHILGPGLSKIYNGNSNKVFSDINVAAHPSFEGGKGILQIISGTQNANPHDMKTYGTLLVDYQMVEGTPVEIEGSFAELPKATVASDMVAILDNVGDSNEAVATMGVGVQTGETSPVDKIWEPGMIFYSIILVIIVGLLLFGITRKNELR
ncbi:hypothetical protein [Alkalihalobacterium elongatum]|uniref:hypothetical protein n=1 Tax=Alkalihalobacterium elongatum TaxID=2675466 RepID=UPI001C1FB4E4|nr:hypothetical protein [Alkalihalobacterium elongatum]